MKFERRFKTTKGKHVVFLFSFFKCMHACMIQYTPCLTIPCNSFNLNVVLNTMVRGCWLVAGGDVLGSRCGGRPVPGAGLEQLLEHGRTSGPHTTHSLQPFVSLTSIGW